MLVQKSVGPKNLSSEENVCRRIITIDLVLAERIHYTETGKNI